MGDDDYSIENLMRVMSNAMSLTEEFRAPRPRIFVALAAHAYPQRVTVSDLEDWRAGRNMPSFLKNFDRWFTATACKHSMPMKLYSLDAAAFSTPVWDMPASPIPEPSGLPCLSYLRSNSA